jgi:glutamine---fructose-6-phosphate transaminase (isomerizing)
MMDQDPMQTAMYRAMRSQPEDMERLLRDGWDQASQAAAVIKGASRVILAGTGTSYHAALVGSWLFRAAGLDALAVPSFDLALYPAQFGIGPGDAVIVMAHTGETGYSARVMKVAVETGSKLLAVSCFTAIHPADAFTLRTVAYERAATFTTSHTSAMLVLAQIATILIEQSDTPGGDQIRRELHKLPDLVARTLERDAEVREVAQLAVDRRTYAIGAGPNEATALEIVIKVREAAFCTIDGMAAEQFLHGPIVAANEGDLAIIVNVLGNANQRVDAISQVLASLGLQCWIIGQPEVNPVGSLIFRLETVPETLSPLLTVIPMQMLAFEMAAIRGTNPDEFRWDDPIYKTAYEQLTL